MQTQEDLLLTARMVDAINTADGNPEAHKQIKSLHYETIQDPHTYQYAVVYYYREYHIGGKWLNSIKELKRTVKKQIQDIKYFHLNSY